MLHAAAMLAGLSTIWLLLMRQGFATGSVATAALVGLACVLFTARFGGVGRRGAFVRAPRDAMLTLARAGTVMRGAFATLRAAVAADVTLNPALVRVKWKSQDPDVRAAFSGFVSAVPGCVVVEAEADGLLVHVNDEDWIDAQDFSQLEARVASGRRTQ